MPHRFPGGYISVFPIRALRFLHLLPDTSSFVLLWFHPYLDSYILIFGYDVPIPMTANSHCFTLLRVQIPMRIYMNWQRFTFPVSRLRSHLIFTAILTHFWVRFFINYTSSFARQHPSFLAFNFAYYVFLDSDFYAANW